MRESEALKKYRIMLAELKYLIKEFGWDAKVTNDQSDSMDAPWLDLSDEDKKILWQGPDIGDKDE
jgi:hypothetical protein